MAGRSLQSLSMTQVGTVGTLFRSFQSDIKVLVENSADTDIPANYNLVGRIFYRDAHDPASNKPRGFYLCIQEGVGNTFSSDSVYIPLLTAGPYGHSPTTSSWFPYGTRFAKYSEIPDAIDEEALKSELLDEFADRADTLQQDVNELSRKIGSGFQALRENKDLGDIEQEELIDKLKEPPGSYDEDTIKKFHPDLANPGGVSFPVQYENGEVIPSSKTRSIIDREGRISVGEIKNLGNLQIRRGTGERKLVGPIIRQYNGVANRRVRSHGLHIYPENNPKVVDSDHMIIGFQTTQGRYSYEYESCSTYGEDEVCRTERAQAPYYDLWVLTAPFKADYNPNSNA